MKAPSLIAAEAPSRVSATDTPSPGSGASRDRARARRLIRGWRGDRVGDAMAPRARFTARVERSR